MAQLRDRQSELDGFNVQILLISFGTESWARAWLDETGAPFPLLLDPQRQAYRAYGMGRSVIGAWGPKVLWRYLTLLIKGRRLRPVRGDPYQLGGDFVVDNDGIVRLAHASLDPTDRPSVDSLLKTVREVAAR